MAYKVTSEKCIMCGACISSCPVDAITTSEDGTAVINAEKCISCGTCGAVCPTGAPVSE